MINNYSIEVIHRVYDNRDGAFIEVRPHPDCPDSLLQVRTTPESRDTFGAIDISLDRQLGEALCTAIKKSLQDLS